MKTSIVGSGAAVRIARRSPGANLGGRYYGPNCGFADSDGRIRPYRYLEEIRRFPMLEPQDEYMLAKRWREHGDRDAAHKLVTSHLRLVAKIAMGYRGYGLPISEVISEGNVGLDAGGQALRAGKRLPLADYQCGGSRRDPGIHPALVVVGEDGHHRNQKKLFFNLRKAKSKISALEEGDLRPDQVKLIAKRLGVTEQDVVDMNRRLGGDVSLNAPIREAAIPASGGLLVDDVSDQETRLAETRSRQPQAALARPFRAHERRRRGGGSCRPRPAR